MLNLGLHWSGEVEEGCCSDGDPACLTIFCPATIHVLSPYMCPSAIYMLCCHTCALLQASPAASRTGSAYGGFPHASSPTSPTLGYPGQVAHSFMQQGSINSRPGTAVNTGVQQSMSRPGSALVSDQTSPTTSTGQPQSYQQMMQARMAALQAQSPRGSYTTAASPSAGEAAFTGKVKMRL